MRHGGDEISLHELNVHTLVVEAERKSGQEQHLPEDGFLLHHVSLIFPESQGAGTGFACFLPVVAQDEHFRHNPDELYSMLQLVRCFHVLGLFLLELRAKCSKSFLVEQEGDFGADRMLRLSSNRIFSV